MIKADIPKIIFLCETKMLSKDMKRVRRNIGFNFGFFVDKVGPSGGLGLIWNDDVDLNIQN